MKTAKMPAKKTHEKVVVHNDFGYGSTACGVDYYFWSDKEKKKKLRKGWGKSVNCERCLNRKKVMDRNQARAKITKKEAKAKTTSNRRVATSIW